MDFRLTPEQQAFQDEVIRFIQHDLPPGWNEEHESLEERMAIERRIMKLLAERRWLALPWPKEYGGGGIDPITALLALEEISRADAGIATAASCSIWAMSPIFPPRENRFLMETFTPRFLSTERWYVGSAAITDARSGSDVENIDGTHGR